MEKSGLEILKLEYQHLTNSIGVNGIARIIGRIRMPMIKILGSSFIYSKRVDKMIEPENYTEKNHLKTVRYPEKNRIQGREVF